MTDAPIPDAYRALIDGPRVSTGTREALLSRAGADDPAYRPVAMTAVQLDVLRAALRRVLPQPDGRRIDLATRLDAQLAAGPGDGWRYAALPEDRAAYAYGLDTLDAQAQAAFGQGFAALDDTRQDEMLRQAAAGALDGERMQLWFEELRGDAAKLYMAHPATLAALGYSGIAYGGDGDAKPGFSLIGLGEREDWEPVSATTADVP